MLLTHTASDELQGTELITNVIDLAANILVCEDGRVQLCDFGIAGVLESKANKRTTILGTPHYMPPEMLDVMASNRVVHYGNEVNSPVHLGVGEVISHLTDD